jgi:hypothetical protein
MLPQNLRTMCVMYFCMACVSCKCGAHQPREERATRDVTFGPLCWSISPYLKNTGSIPFQPGDPWATGRCTSCFCFNNTISCFTDAECEATTTTTITTTTTTLPPMKVHPNCNWTNWINVDNPNKPGSVGEYRWCEDSYTVYHFKFTRFRGNIIVEINKLLLVKLSSFDHSENQGNDPFKCLSLEIMALIECWPSTQWLLAFWSKLWPCSRAGLPPNGHWPSGVNCDHQGSEGPFNPLMDVHTITQVKSDHKNIQLIVPN